MNTERDKLVFELYKYLNTLDTIGIGLTITAYDKIRFDNFYLYLIVSGFLVSLASSFYMMWIIVYPRGLVSPYYTWLPIFSFGGFSAAFACLIGAVLG